MRMTGIDTSPGRETDYDDDSYPSSPIGAINPLMLEDNEGKLSITKLIIAAAAHCITIYAGTESTADYEPAEKMQGSKPANEEESTSLGDGGSQSSSSDSMNPYD